MIVDHGLRSVGRPVIDDNEFPGMVTLHLLDVFQATFKLSSTIAGADDE
jgi:hypothetical protein